MAPVTRSRRSISTILFLAAAVSAQTLTSAPVSATKNAASTVTAVSKCHAHGTVQHCLAGSETYMVVGPTRTEEFASQYTGCHAHDGETYCMSADGKEVEIVAAAGEHADDHEEGTADHEHEDEHDHGHDESADVAAGETHCHFHAGVEHCEGPGSEEATCERTDRDYNIRLRVGLLFVILVTGVIGVFLPILLTSFTRMTQKNLVFILLKQFGTGVVLSTAFIHLFTHAQLMFTNECLGDLAYESTTAAVFLAGLFVSFLVDYMGARFIVWRESHKPQKDEEIRATPTFDDSKGGLSIPHSSAAEPTHSHDQHVHMHGHAEEKVGVLVLEAGVVFHSLLIGLTLVVAGDSFFKNLFAVIVFHQMFEGIALGACIAGLPPNGVSFLQKFIMATVFALITPIGMAIGIGVLGQFNGNDPSTLIAIGTLDAFSAGILAWVGIVEMLAKDWMHGPMLSGSIARPMVGMVGLLGGLILMSLLGKWT